MKKIISIAVLVLIVFTVSEISAQTDNFKRSNELRKESIQKYLAKDYQGFLTSTLNAVRLRKNHPTLLYNTAIGYALTNKPDSSIFFLNKIADMHLYFDAGNDSDFVSLWNNEKFKDVVVRLNSSKEHKGQSGFAFSLPEKDLLTESVAYSPLTETFFVGSIHKRKIYSVSKNGDVQIFAESQKNDFGGVFGIKVDEANNLLWACTGYLPQMKNYNEEQNGIGEIIKFDINTKEIINKYRINEGDHLFGDLTINSNGDVYVSDSRSNNIYIIKNGSDKIELLISSDNFVSLQGIDFSNDYKYLFAADYATGLYKIDLESMNVYSINIPENLTDLGLDGLYFYKNSIIGIQNGVQPQRVIKMNLDDSFNNVLSWEIIEANNEYFFEPTLGVLSGGEFYYIANSQWPLFKNDGSVAPDNELKNPVILKTKLE